MTTDDRQETRDTTLTPALRDVPKIRPCLRCGDAFPSDGFGDRICRRCKGSKSWRSGITTTYGSASGR